MSVTLRESVREILSHPAVQAHKGFIQHGKISVYAHCISVAKLCLKLADTVSHITGAKFDRRSLVRAALLHDFFMYDWHDDWNKLHGFYHPDVARRNACKHFDINPREESIIASHMWPMTLFTFPACREAWILVIADKVVSLRETLFKR
ncbi:hypothetical protein FACS1894133_7630 [Clostridia bacterium]|nr:hypothetical protein FACS1894133_7630 [Clostridia bacterium]